MFSVGGTVLKKLRSKKGYTLVEMQVVIALISITAILSLTIVSAASSQIEMSINTSHFLEVSDVLRAELREILIYSYDISPGDDPDFVCDKYSGWRISVGCGANGLEVNIETPDGVKTVDLIGRSAYAGFEVSDFNLVYQNGIFEYSFTLSRGAVRETVSGTVVPL